MNSHQRRKANRIEARWAVADIKAGVLVSAYGLSNIERRALLQIAEVKSFGEDGLCYVLKTPLEK